MRFNTILFLSVAICCAACAKKNENTLTSQQERWVENYARQELNRLQPKLDSLCEASIKANIAPLVDSLLQSRLLELKNKMGGNEY